MEISNIFLLIFASISFCYGKGSFKTYNSEGRKAYEISLRRINEVDYEGIPLSPSVPTVRRNGGESGGEPKNKYTPDWASLDSRPLPKWYDEAKIGIFIHWGVFSVMGLCDAWFWQQWKTGKKECSDFMKNNYKASFTYQDFAPQFTAEFFNPEEWTELFQKSGAKYVVLTSKHHDGFSLWPTKYSFGWSARDVGPARDIVGELADAIRNKSDLHFGLYHSLYEWYHPLYLEDQRNNYTTQEFVKMKTMPELYEMVNKYKPEVIWSDGDWEAPDSYWDSREFLAWLYNSSPIRDKVVTNDRWGQGLSCKHGGFYSCADGYNPGVLQSKKWENCRTLDKYSWGIRKDAKVSDYLTPEELITTIVESVSCGGNVLINVGPTQEGVIVPIQQERLLQMGEWLGINGEAIYETIPWTVQNDTASPSVWYTSNAEKTTVYAIMTTWPGKEINLGDIKFSNVLNIRIIGYNEFLKWSKSSTGITIELPRPDEICSRWAWTLVIAVK